MLRYRRGAVRRGRDVPKAPPDRERIDKLLVELAFAKSRERAQALVLAGLVLADEQRIDKPGQTVRRDATIRVKGAVHPYVGRGGVKLAAALDAFGLNPAGGIFLDVGASTGGFTDCLLQRGAARVVALDVGHNQIDYRLRTHPRVEVREGVNARHLAVSDFEAPFDGAVIDVSFISLRLILPAVAPLLRPGGLLVALVKPQFEVGRADVGKGGVVRNDAKRHEALRAIEECAAGLGLERLGAIESPIAGADGNREFLLGLLRPAE
ncbi:MAG: TlyA family RNA methyltransferase [Blastocatellia bacterium]|nr:TlyA family RNA methyltransferase [Blastocatellia bacterium]